MIRGSAGTCQGVLLSCRRLRAIARVRFEKGLGHFDLANDMPVEFGEFFRGHPKFLVHSRPDDLPRETRNSSGWMLFSRDDMDNLKQFKKDKRRNGKSFQKETLKPVI